MNPGAMIICLTGGIPAEIVSIPTVHSPGSIRRDFLCPVLQIRKFDGSPTSRKGTPLNVGVTVHKCLKK